MRFKMMFALAALAAVAWSPPVMAAQENGTMKDAGLVGTDLLASAAFNQEVQLVGDSTVAGLTNGHFKFELQAAGKMPAAVLIQATIYDDTGQIGNVSDMNAICIAAAGHNKASRVDKRLIGARQLKI